MVSYPLPPEQTCFRLHEALGTFLQAIGAPHMLVLTLDDLHWADSASLDLLCHLTRRQSHARLLIVGAYRDNEIERNSALSRAVVELSRQRVLNTVEVSPLSVREIETLAVTILGQFVSPSLSSILHMQSEGNPFFAEELIHVWVETDTLAQKDNHWVATTSLEHSLPPSIVGALRQRFIRLPPDIIDHLRVAAIIGRTFDLVLLCTVEGNEIEAVEERLLEAERAHLIHSVQAGIFMFSHDKIRECLYAEVSTSRRKRLHGMIGQALENCCGPEGTMSVHKLAELAFHFARSGDQMRGVEYSQRAAVQALQTFAAEEAISHYQTALDLLGPDEQRRSELLLGLHEARLLADKDENVVLTKPLPPSLPANLTQREAEVLQLVAQGKSNREIACKLTLSEKTVANHLTHIFSKILCDNRAAAVAFAIRHNLA